MKSIALLLAGPVVVALPLAAAARAVVSPPPAGPSAVPPGAPAGEIAWQKSFDDALALAKAENKPLFLAVNMDGESANDWLAEKAYRDKAFLELAARTVNVVASAAEHAGIGRPCPRFAGVECIDHRRIDGAAREKVLKPDSQGYVIAPQHVWIAPDGKVLFSVPYLVSQDELEWCMATAIREVTPDAVKAPPAGRVPRRLVVGGVFDPAKSASGLADRAPTREEALEIVKQMKKSWFALENNEDARRLLMSDEPEVLDFVRQQLRGSIGSFLGGGGGGGGGGRGGGGPGGGGAGARGNGAGRFHAQILHQIGIVSPPTYWELVCESLENADASVRAEAAVALEQLAAPEALRALNAALAKEDEPAVKKEILRALGSAGAADAKVHGTLLKRAKSEKDETLRWNAIAALGFSTADADVGAFLVAAASGKDPRAKTAAACALALSRDKQYVSVLEAQKVELPEGADPSDKQAQAAIGTAIAVLQGAPLAEIEGPLGKICGDTIRRERWFPSRRLQ